MFINKTLSRLFFYPIGQKVSLGVFTNPLV